MAVIDLKLLFTAIQFGQLALVGGYFISPGINILPPSGGNSAGDAYSNEFDPSNGGPPINYLSPNVPTPRQQGPLRINIIGGASPSGWPYAQTTMAQPQWGPPTGVGGPGSPYSPPGFASNFPPNNQAFGPYGRISTSYYTAQQGFSQPSGGPYGLNQGYPQPGGGYSQPGGGYSQPGGGYSQPGGGYSQPSRGYYGSQEGLQPPGGSQGAGNLQGSVLNGVTGAGQVSNFATQQAAPAVTNFATQQAAPAVTNFATQQAAPAVTNAATNYVAPAAKGFGHTVKNFFSHLGRRK